MGEVTYFGSQPWPLPASLMLGFTGRALSTEIDVDGAEIEEARWWTRAELEAAGRRASSWCRAASRSRRPSSRSGRPAARGPGLGLRLSALVADARGGHREEAGRAQLVDDRSLAATRGSAWSRARCVARGAACGASWTGCRARARAKAGSRRESKPSRGSALLAPAGRPGCRRARAYDRWRGRARCRRSRRRRTPGRGAAGRGSRPRRARACSCPHRPRPRSRWR